MLAPKIVIDLASYDYATKLPMLVDLLGHGTGWRVAFILTGAMGLVWIIPWLWLYRQPRQSRLVTTSELQLIEEKGAAASSIETRWTWKQVLTFKATWLLLLGRLLTDAVWYFYQFWFPKYLSTIRSR